MTEEQLLTLFQQEYEHENYESAKDYALSVLKQYPESKKGYSSLGLAAMKMNEIVLAKEAFTNSSFLDDQDIVPYFYLGVLHLDEEELIEAKAYFGQVLSLDPKHVNALSMLANTAVKEERYNTAISYYRQLFELGEIRVEQVLSCLDLYVTLEKYEEALSFFDSIDSKILDENSNLCVIKIDVLKRLGRVDEALEYTRGTIKQYPQDAMLLLNYAILLSGIGAYKELVMYLEVALKKQALDDESTKRAYILLADACERLNLHREAIKAYTKLEEYDYNQVERVVLLERRGGAFVAIKDYKRAIKDYNEAITLSPDSVQLITERAGIFLKAKKYDIAIAEYQKALKIIPDNAIAQLGLGKAYLMQKESKKSLMHLKKAEENGNAEASELLEKYFSKPTKTYKASIMQKVEQKYAEYKQQNNGSAFLSKVIGKRFRFDPIFTYEAVKNELEYLPGEIQKMTWEIMLGSQFIITENAIYFDQGGLLPLYVGFYRIELESNDAILINFMSADGGKELKARLFNQEGALGVTFPINTKDVSSRYFQFSSELTEAETKRLKFRAQKSSAPLPQNITAHIEAL